MNFSNNIAILRTARVTAPVVVLLLTLVLGFRSGSFDHSFSSTVSPLEATFALGLPLFPAAVFFLLNGLLIRTQQSAHENWPAVTGHIMETKYRLTYLRGGPFVDFWYAFNGKRHETYSIQYRHLPRSRSPFRPGMTVDVRVDPDNPEFAVPARGDDAARFYMWAAATALAIPPVIGLLLTLSR